MRRCGCWRRSSPAGLISTISAPLVRASSEIIHQARIVPVRNDGGVVGTLADAREHLSDGRLCGTHEVGQAVGRCQHIVRGQADLAGVERLAVHDPRRGHGHVGGAADDDGALAAQFQRHRHEVLGGRPHHMPADRGRAGEDQMVEGQGGEGLSDLRAAGDHGNLARVEGAGEHLLQQLRRCRRRLRRLDHRPISGSQDTRPAARR